MADYQDLFLDVGNNETLHVLKGGQGNLVLLAVRLDPTRSLAFCLKRQAL